MTVNNITDQYFNNYFPASEKISDASNSSGVSVSSADDNIVINFSSDNDNESDDDMAVIAHRGYSEVAPENTIPAFIAAAENGYDTIECDVSWTKDSVPVILHDDTINRTARKENGWGFFFKRKCSDYTYEQLLQYDFGVWKGKEFKGTKIPSFDEVLECGKEYDLNLYIELKETDDFDEEKAKILVDAVKDAGLEDKVTWISFNDDYLKTISDIMPECRLGYLSKKKPTEKTIEILDSLKTEDNDVFLDVKASKVTEKSAALLDDAGFDFEAWTVDKSSSLDDLYSYDCKGITTNSLTDAEVEEYLNNLDNG